MRPTGALDPRSFARTRHAAFAVPEDAALEERPLAGARLHNSQRLSSLWPGIDALRYARGRLRHA